MSLDPFQLGFLFIASIATSCINSVVAVGGGMTLFVIMISMVHYAIVVPVHGIIQMWSSISRVWVFRRHVNFKIMKYFFLTFVPSSLLGMYLWQLLIRTDALQPYVKIAIAIYLILFLSGKTITIHTTDQKKLMIVAGAWSGMIGLTAGSPAPVMAPFFIKADLRKEEFIGTWALAGVMIHSSKLPLFYFIWDEIKLEHLWLIILLTIGVLTGTYVGKALLGKISQSLFRRILTGVLLFLAAKLIVWDGFRMILFAA